MKKILPFLVLALAALIMGCKKEERPVKINVLCADVLRNDVLQTINSEFYVEADSESAVVHITYWVEKRDSLEVMYFSSLEPCITHLEGDKKSVLNRLKSDCYDAQDARQLWKNISTMQALKGEEKN